MARLPSCSACSQRFWASCLCGGICYLLCSFSVAAGASAQCPEAEPVSISSHVLSGLMPYLWSPQRPCTGHPSRKFGYKPSFQLLSSHEPPLKPESEIIIRIWLLVMLLMIEIQHHLIDAYVYMSLFYHQNSSFLYMRSI